MTAMGQQEKCDLTTRRCAIEGFYSPQVFGVSALDVGPCFRVNTGRLNRSDSLFDIVWSEATGKYDRGTNTLHYHSTDAPVVRHALSADLCIAGAMTVE